MANEDLPVDARGLLRRVLEWPTPNGTVETYTLPRWLAKAAREVADAPEIVYAVEWGDEIPSEIDSLWTTAEAAQPRADRKNREAIGGGNWRVRPWNLRTGEETKT